MSISARHPTTRHRWLLVIPFLWQVGLAPAVNGIATSPFAIPFPMLWQMMGIVVTTCVIAYVFYRDRLAGVDDAEAAFLETMTDAEKAGK